MSGVKISALPSGVPTLDAIVPFTNSTKTETFYGEVDDFLNLTAISQGSAIQINGSGNNYDPGTTADIVRISGINNATLTGLDYTAYPNDAGLFINVGSGDITLKHLNASSSQTNRFAIPYAADFVVVSGGAALIVRDYVDNFWRVV
jgi:hypothetical protein